MHPAELAGPDAGRASEHLVRLPDALEGHGLADSVAGVLHDDTEAIVGARGGDLKAVVGALEVEGHISGLGLGDGIDEDGVEPVLLLASLTIFGPLGKEVDTVADTDGAVGQDDGEGLLAGVGVPVELSLVDKHCSGRVTKVRRKNRVKDGKMKNEAR